MESPTPLDQRLAMWFPRLNTGRFSAAAAVGWMTRAQHQITPPDCKIQYLLGNTIFCGKTENQDLLGVSSHPITGIYDVIRDRNPTAMHLVARVRRQSRCSRKQCRHILTVVFLERKSQKCGENSW